MEFYSAMKKNEILLSHEEEWNFTHPWRRMKFYSAMKKNEISSFASKWMELENIILSKVSQAQKTKKVYALPHMWTLDLGQMQQCFWTCVTC
jgi:lysyl-tRNA synthetase class II